jgi:hypothetical protein
VERRHERRAGLGVPEGVDLGGADARQVAPGERAGELVRIGRQEAEGPGLGAAKAGGRHWSR